MSGRQEENDCKGKGMGLFDFLKNLFREAPVKKEYISRFTVNDLVQRTGLNYLEIRALEPVYKTFPIPKRSGGQRTIESPDDKLKQIQRTILRKLLARLKAHPNVTGFERGHSIVTNANVHVGAEVVIRLDIKDFFGRTSAGRVLDFFRSIGWNQEAAELVTKLTTNNNHLPQGAPTSPRLANLVNYLMDVRLARLAEKIGAVYTRYADDITFSIPKASTQTSGVFSAQNPKTLEKLPVAKTAENYSRYAVALAIRTTKLILADYGYKLHHKRKLHIRRNHQRQMVTGLVVNEKVNLPRLTRRRLRAVEHHLATSRPASLTPVQMAGWQALRNMIQTQAESSH